MDKKNAVAALEFTADVLELLGENEFRVLGFRRASRALERFDGDWDEAVAERFRHVSGIGSQLGFALTDFAQSGAFGPLDEASALVPPGVLELFRVRGLGPKRIRMLWLSGIDSLGALIQAAQQGDIARMKGFGKNTEAAMLESALFVLRSSTRRHISIGHAVFKELQHTLAGKAELEASGSLRRGLETVGNVNAVAVGEREEIMRALAAFGAYEHPEHPWVILAEIAGVGVELTISEPQARGAALAVTTGSLAFLQTLFAQADARGLELTSQGLYDAGTLVPTPSEEELFSALGLEHVIPEWREEEHLQQPSKRPRRTELITQKAIQGMLHVHTNWSDGANTIREMALAAKERGATYIGICDHSQTAAYAHGLEPERLLAQWAEIEALNTEGLGIRILKGIESDILPDGTLDYDEALLEKLDFVVASIHSSFQLSEAEQTERIIRAVSNPFTTILGHPTGRLLLRRPPYRLNLQAVLEAAAEHNTVIEINANAYRLDLDWREVLGFQNRSLRFAINTDAHNTDGLDDIIYGIGVARKAGLELDQIINTMNPEAFLELAHSKHSH